MPRVVEVKNEKRVSSCMSQQQLAQIEKAAIEMSRQEGRIITVSEAIRRALAICYPVPQQLKF